MAPTRHSSPSKLFAFACSPLHCALMAHLNPDSFFTKDDTAELMAIFCGALGVAAGYVLASAVDGAFLAWRIVPERERHTPNEKILIAPVTFVSPREGARLGFAIGL